MTEKTDPNTVTLSTGETVTLKSPAWRHLAAMEAAKPGFTAVVAALYGTVTGLTDDSGLITMTPDTALDVVPILADNQEAVATMVGLYAGRSPEWVKDQDFADLITLVGAVRGCGLRFFTARLVHGLVDFVWASTNQTPPSPEPPTPDGKNPPTTTETPSPAPG